MQSRQLDADQARPVRRWKGMLAKFPMGRFGEFDDVIGAAIFLAAPASRCVTGGCLGSV